MDMVLAWVSWTITVTDKRSHTAMGSVLINNTNGGMNSISMARIRQHSQMKSINSRLLSSLMFLILIRSGHSTGSDCNKGLLSYLGGSIIEHIDKKCRGKAVDCLGLHEVSNIERFAQVIVGVVLRRF